MRRDRQVSHEIAFLLPSGAMDMQSRGHRVGRGAIAARTYSASWRRARRWWRHGSATSFHRREKRAPAGTCPAAHKGREMASLFSLLLLTPPLRSIRAPRTGQLRMIPHARGDSASTTQHQARPFNVGSARRQKCSSHNRRFTDNCCRYLRSRGKKTTRTESPELSRRITSQLNVTRTLTQTV